MNINDFIKAKQESKNHSKEEIFEFIKELENFTQEEITLWLKATKTNGLTDEETANLTMAMAKSGTMLSWEGLEPTVDKHSTGGIGDKVTLLFVPLIAACGINIPKLSGRSLGITGGTIDKLESISGLRTDLSIDQIKDQVKKIGLAVASAGKDLAPAEKKLYMIRDVTDTIDSIPLIAASIMAKKFAGGASNIILDVKFGSGAFMKTLDRAKALANAMVKIGKNQNKKTKAVISNMNEPLGFAVGNSLEIKEVLEILSGKEVQDLIEIVIFLARETISFIDPAVGICHGKSFKEDTLKKMLLKGEALNKFEEMVQAQGGNLKNSFKKAPYMEQLKSNKDGYIHKIDALTIGEAVHSLGAGRKKVSDRIDHSVGIYLFKKHGDKVKINEPIMEIYGKNQEEVERVKSKLLSGIKIEYNEPPELKLIEEVI